MRGSTASFAHSFNRTDHAFYSLAPISHLKELSSTLHNCNCKCLTPKNAQKNITPSPKTLPFPQETREAPGVEAPEALWLWRVPVLRFEHSSHSSLPSKRVQEQRPPRLVFFLVSVLVLGEFESGRKWGMPAGGGSAKWELPNWRWVHRSRGWRRRRIGGWEGWAVHWEFLPADQNAEAEIPIALLFTFTCAAPLNHFCLCFHFLTNCGAFFFLLKLILYFSILTFLHFLFFQWLFYLFFLITSFDLCSLRT